MLYALMIYQNEELVDALSAEDHEALLEAHRELQADTQACGRFRNATQLMPSETATTVHRKAGDTLITDGPFAETKEIFVGFYILDCEDLDDAMAQAERIPYAGMGSIEIRPIQFLTDGQTEYRP